MLEDKTLSQKRKLIYFLGFLFALAQALPTYISSSYLAHFMPESLVGIIYTASSLMALAAFIEIQGVLRRFGNLRVTVCLLGLALAGFVGMVSGYTMLSIIAAFMLNFVAISLTNFTIDIFLESFSMDSRTGSIRGTFLTITNLAWLTAPFLSSKLLGETNFSNVYLASGIFIVPVILLIVGQLRDFKDPTYTRMPFWRSLGDIWADRDIKAILLVQFLLQFFYAWMIIYTPIYLHETVGFDWSVISLIFTVMLLPFVFIEGPLGRLADRHGEKNILSVGFLVMALFTVLIAFVTDHNAYLWAGILFMTRVGAAAVEVMAETYFFKKVDASKAHLISFSRMTRPFAYVIGPVVATVLFTVFDMKGLFIFLGFLMLYGLRYTFALKDTA